MATHGETPQRLNIKSISTPAMVHLSLHLDNSALNWRM